MPRLKHRKMQARSLHESVLEGLADSDPKLYEELTELRRYNPLAYRKRMRKLIRAGAEPSDFSRYEPLPVNEGYESLGPGIGIKERLEQQFAAARDRAAADAAGREETDRKRDEAAKRQAEHEERHAERQKKNQAAPSPSDLRRAAMTGPDLSILDGSIGDLKNALATGAHDGHLDALLAAEEAGASRKGALKAIRERMG